VLRLPNVCDYGLSDLFLPILIYFHWAALCLPNAVDHGFSDLALLIFPYFIGRRCTYPMLLIAPLRGFMLQLNNY